MVPVIVPATVQQFVALLLLVVPGMCYAAVRRRLKGPMPEDREFSVRLVRALVVSVFLNALYVAAFGDALVRMATQRSSSGVEGFAATPRKSALLALALLVVVPAALGVLAHVRWVPRSGRRAWFWPLGLAHVNHPTPSAWDLAAPPRGGCFVRIFTSDGYWVGGWLGKGAYISTYPEPRDIFIEVEWKMSKDGGFVRPVPNSMGVFVPLSGCERVAWIANPEDVATSTAPDQSPPEAGSSALASDAGPRSGSRPSSRRR